MSEALFAINLKGELMSISYYKIDNELLKRNLVDELILREVLQRANNRHGTNWNFTFKDVWIDILSKNLYKIEFFVARDEQMCVNKITSSKEYKNH